MAERRPLIMIDGEVQELPLGDTLPGGGGGPPMAQTNFAADISLTNTHFAGEHVAIGTSGSALNITVTVGLAAAAPATFIQAGAESLTFVPDTGVTIVSPDSLLSTRTQGSFASLVPDLTTPNRYYLIGDLA